MAMGTVAANLLALAVSAAPTVYMNGHLPSAADSQAMHDLGAAGVRMDFNWYDFEPQQGNWNWQYLDDVVNAARAQGLSIFATVAYTPDWASSRSGCVPHSPDDTLKCDNTVPANVQDWKNAVTAVVTRYKGKVDCWGIWNEPNLGTFFQGTMDDYVNSIFLPAEAAIRAADPQARVCGPELSGLTSSSSWNGKNGQCAFGSCIRNGWELDLGGLLDRIGPKLDVITQHFYKSDAAGVVGIMLDGETSFGVLTHDSLKHVLETHGAGSKEVWLTETGWEHGPQGSMAEADVATRIVDLYGKQEEVCGGAYAASLNDPWKNWTRTYYFHFPYDPGSGWGIVGPAEAPLAPYSALKNWTNGKSTTACGLSGTGGGTGGGVGGGAGGGTGGGGGSGGAGGSSGGGAGGGAAGGAGGGTGGGTGGGATGGSGGTGAGGDPGTGGSGGSGAGGSAGVGGSGGSVGTGGSTAGTGGTGGSGGGSSSSAGGEAPIAATPGSGCAAVPGPETFALLAAAVSALRRRRSR